ncbi:hypothetical protein GYB22_10790 [bacterium]|nr:hypothetical protein [bacterium]
MSLSAKAQKISLDSARTWLQDKPRVIVGFHNRNTLVNTDKVKLYGGMIGLEYRNKLKLYVGIYGFGNENRAVLTNSSLFEEDTVVRLTSVSNLSVGVEYTFYTHKRWSFSAPVQLGFGAMYTDYFSNNALIERNDLGLFPLEGGVNAYYEIFSWFGIKGGAGYRLNIGKAPVRKLSAPYYSIGLSFVIINLYREIEGRIGN